MFVDDLKGIVGRGHVLTRPGAMRAYVTGFRCGGGRALAVVRPGSLVELWRVLQACVAANKIVIPQAANTGLTGGSTPAHEGYDRELVVINTRRLSRLFVIEDGRQVICLPGTTLHQLERALQRFGREPHSVIGSSCIGASVIGGICNNSGGALLRRGPAYTEMSLYARVNEQGHLQLVNHLGVDLGADPEAILGRLERGAFSGADIQRPPGARGSDVDYMRRVREIDSPRPARFNADPTRLFEASGSAGRVMVFAVRVDSFPKDAETRVFYIGTNDTRELTGLRRHILSRFEGLPVAGEYLHLDMFDVADVYGKDIFLAIQHLGSRRLPGLLKLQSRLGLSEKLLQRLGRLFPDHLPARMRAYHGQYVHHLILKMAGGGIGEAVRYLGSIFPSAHGDFFKCTEEEANKAFLHRFVAAGAAVRYRAVHADEVEDIVALDIALRQNDPEWFEILPPEIKAQVSHALYYGHFFCNVWHQDYVVRKGCDTEALKASLLKLLDARGAEYPAEHNVGHLYRASPALMDHYRGLDPSNSFNAGIGGTPKSANWGAA